jgi:hypothetical protein
MEILGYEKTHHLMPDFGRRSIQLSKLRLGARIVKAKDQAVRHALIRALYQDVDVILDVPGNIIVDDLVQVYPDAKVGSVMAHLTMLTMPCSLY